MVPKRLTAAACAAAVLIMCSACADSSDKKSTRKKAADKSDSSVERTVSDGEDKSSENSPKNDQMPLMTASQSENMTRLCDFLQSDSYSLRMTYTDAEGKNTDIYRVVDGDNYYQLQKNDVGQSGSIRKDGQSYDFDFVCGICRKSSADKLDSLIETVVSEDLPATATHIDGEDAALYDVEEYTYTGATYIAVMDICFDKDTGMPVKYTTTYLFESDDDLVEQRTFDELLPRSAFINSDETPTDGEDKPGEVDTSVIDTAFIDQLTDFDSLTEEQRMGYCKAIFVTAGVTDDELEGEGFSEEKLKNISYEDLVYLVYNYGYDNEY